MSNPEIKKHSKSVTMQHPENDEQYSGLQVNAGVEQPPIVSPYIKNRKKRQKLTVNDYHGAGTGGDAR